MTEMSPVGTVGVPCAGVSAMSYDEQMPYRLKQGRTPLGVEMKLTSDEGALLPHDGKTFGRLKVRGHSIARGYFRGEGGDVLDEHGFFDTGDVATLDSDGYMQITDRSKDVIKSGGEWISSIDIENFAVGHPDVLEAAVIGVAHPKWDERPLLVIVPAKGKSPGRDEMLGFLDGKIAKWWMPDDVVFVEEIPLGATGKIDKKLIRQQFEGYRFPTAQAAE
jgi:fatty-acyl-CoA synthase